MTTKQTATNDLLRAERELAAIAERTAVGQRLDSDDVAEATLNRVAETSREAIMNLDPNEAPPAPIILVTTGHPTLHQHPGPNGERVHPRLGRLIQPRHTSSIELTAAAGIPWAADNDCFQGLDEERFVRMLDRIAGLPGCLFVTVPDVVADATATLALFDKWHPELVRRGLPAGYVAQDGATSESTPWDRIAAVFIGGSDEYKLGPNAARLAREAKRRGKWVHWGRVNTRKRYDLIRATGAADSFDGSKWARWRKTYLPTALVWLEEAFAERLEVAAAWVEVERRGLARVAGGTNEFDLTVDEIGERLGDLADRYGTDDLDVLKRRTLDALEVEQVDAERVELMRDLTAIDPDHAERLRNAEAERAAADLILDDPAEANRLLALATARRLTAELVVLESYDERRRRLGHDYGNGQRQWEIIRRGRAISDALRAARTGRTEPTAEDLAEAAVRVLGPRLRRVAREGYRLHTEGTGRTREALAATIARFAPLTVIETADPPEPVELDAAGRREATRIRRALEARGIPALLKREPTDELAEFRGPDGELGTDAEYVERILDARAADAEAVDLSEEV